MSNDILTRYGITPGMSCEEVADRITDTLVVYTLDEEHMPYADIAAILQALTDQARAEGKTDGKSEGRREAWEKASLACYMRGPLEPWGTNRVERRCRGQHGRACCQYDRCPLMQEANHG